MSVTLYYPDGTGSSGDPAISQVMKDHADEIGGYVTDDESGDILYDARKGA